MDSPRLESLDPIDARCTLWAASICESLGCSDVTKNDLISRASDHEDNYVERKSAGVKGDEIRQTLSAFANSLPSDRQAILFVGIEDKGGVSGCPNTDAVQKRVSQCGRECYPPIHVTCEVVKIDGEDVVAVIVNPSSNRPHFTGPAYMRRGSESINASPELFEEMVASRNTKAGALLRLKGQLVTVVGVGHNLGSTRRVAPRDHHEQDECRVAACDAHSVQLVRINNGLIYSEGLDRVELSHDHMKGRPKLIVRSV